MILLCPTPISSLLRKLSATWLSDLPVKEYFIPDALQILELDTGMIGITIPSTPLHLKEDFTGDSCPGRILQAI
jgi:hypothetical protein